MTSHITLAFLMTVFCVWYLFDAWSAEASLYNLVLIAPAGCLGILIGIGVLVAEALSWRSEAAEAPEAVATGTFPMMGLLMAFVCLLPIIGFTAATFLFLVGALWILGVRRRATLVLYPAVVTTGLIFGLQLVVRLPEPMIGRLLGGQ